MSDSALISRSHNKIGWQPGQSGNPGGRPKKPADVSRLCARLGIRAVDVLEQLLADNDPRMRFAAAKEILDRGYGKPVQAIATQDGVTLTIQHLTAAQAFSEALRAGAVPMLEATPVDTHTDVDTAQPDVMEPAKE